MKMSDEEMIAQPAADSEVQAQADDTAVAADDDDDDDEDGNRQDDVNDDEDGVTESVEPVSEQDGRQQIVARVYNCTACSRSFTSRREIVTHRYMHRENPSVFCSLCNKSFSTESAYRRHAASHSRKSASSRRPRKTCSQCDMQFDTMRQLSAHHAAKHVDQKRFICAICGSQFAWPENLRAHQRTHELDPHECEICGRRFVDATSLRVHTRNSHGPSSETSAQRKQHCCKVCGRSFQFDFSLRAHMKGHAQSPVAASLRRSKHYSSKLTSTNAVPVTQTKYVRVDSKGVIDLGMDVAQATANEPSEVIVEVYNTLDNNVTTQQSLDFSDVLDQSTLLLSGTQMDTTDHTLDMRTDHTDDDSMAENSTSKLVWYVKPDARDDSQQRCSDVADDDDDDDDGVDEKLQSSEQNNDPIQPTAAAAAAAADDGDASNDVGGGGDGDGDGDAVGSESGHDDSIGHQHRRPSPSVTSEVVPAVGLTNQVVPAVAVATEAATKSNVDYDDDENDDDDDDEIDWMDEEPPRRRAAPFLFKQASSSGRRRVTRPREPFLFNCVMTDEKPFICVTCGESFRWEISLNIHQRLHIDGTFPNKLRSANTRTTTKQSSRRRGKSKQTSTTSNKSVSRNKPVAGSKSVARSCIVQHRRTSSDEEDDEFTFHVHADGPSEVSTAYRYHELQRLVQRGRGRGRGGARGQGHGRSGSVAVIGREHKPLSVSVSSGSLTVTRHIDTELSTAGNAGCNGVSCDLEQPQISTVRSQQSNVSHSQMALTAGHTCKSRRVNLRQSGKVSSQQAGTVKSSDKHGRVALRAYHICQQCRRVVTCLTAFNRHRRRAHVTTPLNCHFCSAQFTSRLDLQRHRQQLHDTVSVTNVMKCRRCQRVFTDSKRLQRHYKLHLAAVKPTV